jgi:hypothetical protein
MLLQGQVGIKAGGSNNYKLPHYTKDRFVCMNGRPVPMRLWSDCPPSTSSSTGTSSRSGSITTSTSSGTSRGSLTNLGCCWFGWRGRDGLITAMLKDLSLEAAEEMDVNREDITAELATEWMRRKERRWLRIDDVPMAMVVLCLCVGLCLSKRPMKERDLTSLKHLHRN